MPKKFDQDAKDRVVRDTNELLKSASAFPHRNQARNLKK